MTSARLLLPIGALLLAPVLVACGGEEADDAGAGHPTAAEETNESPGPTASSPETTEGTELSPLLPAACEVVTQQDVANAYGVEFGPSEPGGGGTTEGDLEWQSDNCNWEAEDLAEVTFALTGPEDFADRTLHCPEPTAIASTVKPVPGVEGATSAWWEVDDAPPLEATLRVCTPQANFDIELEYEDGVDFQGDPEKQTIALAKAVLDALGGA